MAYLERNAEGYLGKLVSEAGERIYLRRAFDVMDWATNAYSGTQGCCCGCQGNYYNKATGAIYDHRKDDSTTDMARATKQFNITRIQLRFTNVCDHGRTSRRRHRIM